MSLQLTVRVSGHSDAQANRIASWRQEYLGCQGPVQTGSSPRDVAAGYTHCPADLGDKRLLTLQHPDARLDHSAENTAQTLKRQQPQPRSDYPEQQRDLDQQLALTVRQAQELL